jgi:hypothetical protein
MPITQSRNLATRFKSITAHTSTSNEIMYTVPSGKSFTGVAVGSNSSAKISVNGSNIFLYVNSTGANSTPVPLKLFEGDIVKCVGSQDVSIHGEES